MFKGTLFGSLSAFADFTDLERRAFNRAASDFGHDLGWTLGGYRALCRAHGRFHAVKKAARLSSDGNPMPVLENVERHFRDLLDEADVMPHPWFVKFQEDARRRGVRLGLVTGAFRQTTLRALSNVFRSRASQVFDVITAAEDEVSHKPNRALFDLALERLKLRPEQAIAFETTHDGVYAAQAAGLFTVGLPGVAVPNASLDIADANGQLSVATLAKALKRQRHDAPMAA